MRALLALALLAAAPAGAGDAPMTAAEFESYATGRTLTYGIGGQIYGIEQYLPGRRVRWAFAGDVCRIGHWYESGAEICFVYEHDQTPQCWMFFRTGEGLRARFMGDGDATDLSEVAQSDAPLACAGPDVGV